MALFSRSLKPGSEGGLPDVNGEAGAESSPRHTIGELLRQTRQSYGGDIDRIAATLRIRASYLTAIELGQYDKLPGPVYAQGFVRAYAVHLGLDGDEAIRRFKQEIAGFGMSRDLSFPVPLAERSIPGGTMVLAALILAICGYGLWYYVSTSDRSHPERVSAVPPDLIAAAQKPALLPNTAPPAPPPAASTVPGSPPPATTPPDAATAAPASATGPAATPSRAVASAAPATPAASPPPTATAPAAAPPAQTPAESPAPPPRAATTAPAPGQTASAETTPAQTAAAPATPASSVPESDTAATPPAAPAHVYGAPADVPARIVVHAIKDSWVQLRNGDEILVQRILHPGDSLRVPDESGLSLRTGNGAGLQLEIDGKLGKPLSGTVRTVALDADRLSASGGNVPRPE